MDDYVTKPIDSALLEKVIHKWLNANGPDLRKAS